MSWHVGGHKIDTRTEQSEESKEIPHEVCRGACGATRWIDQGAKTSSKSVFNQVCRGSLEDASGSRGNDSPESFGNASGSFGNVSRGLGNAWGALHGERLRRPQGRLGRPGVCLGKLWGRLAKFFGRPGDGLGGFPGKLGESLVILWRASEPREGSGGLGNGSEAFGNVSGSL